MTEPVLVDTTIWIDFLRGGNEPVRDRVSVLVTADKAATADIIILELLRGARSRREYRTLHQDLTALPRLPLAATVWERAWGIGYDLRSKGVHVPTTDTIIAALAIEHACGLLHRDRHFDLIAGCTGLKALRVEEGSG